MPEIKLDSVKNNFVKYLDSLGISQKSHKNYRSDLSHFAGWLIIKIRTFGAYVENITEAVPFLNKGIALEYKTFLQENKIPDKTINRRLSTLRHFAKFLLISQIIDFDFTEGLLNITKTATPKAKETFTTEAFINEFRSYLETDKASKNTVKNYLSDVRQFLIWLDKNQETLSKSI